MRKQLLTSALMALALISGAQTVSTFDNISLSANSVKNGSGAPLYGKFTSGKAEFPNEYQTSYGGFWNGGWAYSNIQNDTNGTYTNMYASFANGGHNSPNYGVGQQGAVLRLSATETGTTVKGCYLTNGTYPALTVKNGDGFSKKFGGVNGNDPDYFVVIIKAWLNGTQKSDSVNFFLADYRAQDSANDYIVKNWTWVDLSSLGNVDSLSFSMASTDEGQFGINTPLFFCIDDVVTATDTADFENLNLAAGKFWNKSNGTVRDVYASGNALFSSAYTVSGYGDYWSKGFAISNKTDSSSASGVSGYGLLYTAITGTGVNSSPNYAIVQNNSIIRLTGGALGKQLDGVYVTNSNYAYLSMKWGDAFARKFNDTDFFAVKITGYKAGAKTDSVLYYLAQNGQIKNTWEWVDLKPLGNVDSIMFSLTSSDVGQFGMNTPGFFAIDNFTTRDAAVGLTSVMPNTLQTTVYPNPANNWLALQVSENARTMHAEVYDATGVQYINTQLTAGQNLDITQLGGGLYFVKVTCNGKTSVVRFVKK